MLTDGDYRNRLVEEVNFGDERMGGAGNVKEVLTRIELDLACCSEKVLNLEMLLMHVSNRASDFEALGLEKEAVTIDFLEKTFEFDILAGILVSEVKELELITRLVEEEIKDAHEKITEAVNLGICMQDAEEKLKDAEKSLKQSFDLILDIKAQSLKAEKVLVFGDREPELECPEKLSLSEKKWPMQTIEQQKQTLQMLEKSLARELDLEKKLSDSRHNEEEIKLKLHYAEHEIYFLEEAIESILERYFEAENAAVVFMGIAKELTGQLQLTLFSLNGYVGREKALRSKIEQNMLKLSEQESTIVKLKSANMDIQSLVQQASTLKLCLKEAEDRCQASNLDASVLRNKVKVLEEQLKESNSLLQEAKDLAETSQEQRTLLNAELVDMENAILDLKENMAKTESRAENAEAKCSLLAETNLELNQELGILKSNDTKRTSALEEKLKESDAQLENAKASYEAIEEQQIMLYSTLTDMETMIEELKARISKAEKRAESAETRCKLLTETNLELNEEVGSLRDKLEYLEKSLLQADHVRVVTAKDIGIKTKVITDLVVKLALERERLQIQIMSLKKENKLLANKSLKTYESGGNHESKGQEDSVSKTSEERVMESSATHSKVETTNAEAITAIASVNEGMPIVLPDDKVESELAPVRRIEAGQLNCKHAAAAVFFLVLAVLGMYIYQSA